MAKLRINGDSSGYVDLEAPNAASSSTLDLDQVPQKNNSAGDVFTHGNGKVEIRDSNGYTRVTATNGSAQIGLFRQGGSAGGFYIGGDASLFRIFDTSFNSKVSITTSGEMTVPNQPVFMARKSADQSIVNNDKITFESAIVNKGSHYNATNNRFTAPVDGTYSFSINLRCGIENNARVLTTAIYKNGSSLYGRFAGAGGIANFSDGGSYDHPYISGTIILPLNANDYIEIYFGAENSYSGNGMIQSSANSSYFMGHLIG